jgi:hypothetical protein
MPDVLSGGRPAGLVELMAQLRARPAGQHALAVYARIVGAAAGGGGAPQPGLSRL